MRPPHQKLFCAVFFSWQLSESFKVTGHEIDDIYYMGSETQKNRWEIRSVLRIHFLGEEWKLIWMEMSFLTHTVGEL